MDKHGRSMPDAFARISLNLDLKAVICGYDLFRKKSTILHTCNPYRYIGWTAFESVAAIPDEAYFHISSHNAGPFAENLPTLHTPIAFVL